MILLYPPGTIVRITSFGQAFRDRRFIVVGRNDGWGWHVRPGWLQIEDIDDKERVLEIPDHFVERVPSALIALAEVVDD